MNEKMVTLHLLEDVFGWAVLLLSALIMLWVDVPILDPILSIGYAVFILIQVYRNGKQMVGILMEKAPEGLDMQALKNKIVALDFVIGIHHIHVWSLDGNQTMMTFHAVLDGTIDKDTMMQVHKQIHEVVEEAGIHHATIEIELDNLCQEVDCGLGDNEVHHHHHHH